ncbi:PDK repeat-containing protein [Thermoplasmatales archaeon SCGC AB-539-N05]|nr:PDK repeat-containing protein [Thermoplasmatales archaeon SCGC AB-539-N05]
MDKKYSLTQDFFTLKKLKYSKFLFTIVMVLFLLLSFLTTIHADEVEIEWVRVKDVGIMDKIMATAIDSENNIIVTGYSYNEGSFNYYTIKYDPVGNILWDAGYDGRWTDMAYGVAVDSEDNVIVTGTSVAPGNNYEYYTIKYNADGAILWNATCSGEKRDIAYDVTVDAQDNIIVTGSYGNVGTENYYTVKYDKNGNEIWKWFYGGRDNDIAQGVAIDSTGHIIVTGKSYFSGSWNWYTIKYDYDGTVIWDAAYATDDDDFACDIATDSQNNVIVTGRGHKSGHNCYYTVKYNPDGNILWNTSFDGDGSGSGTAYGVAIDASDNILVTGAYKKAGFWYYNTITYSPDGDITWSDLHSSRWKDYGRAIAVDSRGNIIVAGYSEIGDYDYYTIKYHKCSTNLHPVANFSFDPLLPTQVDTIEFTDQSTDPDGFIVNWSWDFGDGSYAYTKNATYQYADEGVYTVTLTVEDNNSAIDSIEKVVTVANMNPVAGFDFEPLSPTIADVVYFNSTSIDHDGIVVSWYWDFGDGSYAYTENATHQYMNNDIYTAILTVEDNDGANDTISKTVMVGVGSAVTRDVDLDEINEVAIDSDGNVLNGYETYNDPNGNSDATISIDGDNDGKIDHFIDITGDETAEKYWDPDEDIVSNITLSDVDNDGTDEWEYDSDGDGNPDMYYDPDDGTVNDAEPPSRVEGLTVIDAKDGKLDLRWNVATDNLRIDYYNIFRDEAFLTTVVGASYQDTGLTNGRSYSYEISAVDTSENEGNKSDPQRETPTASSPSPPGSGGGYMGPTNTAPNKPLTPDGLIAGFINTNYTYSTSTADSENDDVYYWFDWDDDTNSGWLGPYSSSTAVSKSHSWTTAGTYSVKAKAKDINNKESSWSDILTVVISKGANYPPNTPDQPEGLHVGDINISYTFSTSTIDPNNDGVKYEFAWGDNTTSFTTLVASGETVSREHSWAHEGTYYVKVRAYDKYNVVSNWSEDAMFIIDKTKPVISIVTPDENDIIGGNVDIIVNASDEHLVNVLFELIKDVTTLESYNMYETPHVWPLDTTGYDDGHYTLKVTAYDSSGNTNTVSADFTICQEETASIIGTLLIGIIILGSIVAAIFVFVKRRTLFTKNKKIKG